MFLCSYILLATDVEATIPETIKALVMTIPQSEIYIKISTNLQSWIDGSKKNYQQAEEDAAKATPGLFKEYALTNDEGRSELLVCRSFSITLYA